MCIFFCMIIVVAELCVTYILTTTFITSTATLPILQKWESQSNASYMINVFYFSSHPPTQKYIPWQLIQSEWIIEYSRFPLKHILRRYKQKIINMYIFNSYIHTYMHSKVYFLCGNILSCSEIYKWDEEDNLLFDSM